jgi:hypothetical protein
LFQFFSPDGQVTGVSSGRAKASVGVPGLDDGLSGGLTAGHPRRWKSSGIGGVAHDFNNLQMAVLSNLDLLRKHVPEDSRSSRLIDGAVQGAKRGAAASASPAHRANWPARSAASWAPAANSRRTDSSSPIRLIAAAA